MGCATSTELITTSDAAATARSSVKGWAQIFKRTNSRRNPRLKPPPLLPLLPLPLPLQTPNQRLSSPKLRRILRNPRLWPRDMAPADFLFLHCFLEMSGQKLIRDGIFQFPDDHCSSRSL